MTIRKDNSRNIKIGNMLKSYRDRLTDLPEARQKFIDNRSDIFFGGDDWISEKTLSNYENGKNIPSLENLKKLAVAFEVDETELVLSILKLL